MVVRSKPEPDLFLKAAELLGIGDGAFNQRLMTQMDTVEIAKSDD